MLLEYLREERALLVLDNLETLMEEGTAKFADPQKALLALIAEKRGVLAGK